MIRTGRVFIIGIIVGVAGSLCAQNLQRSSRWDRDILSIQLHDVNISRNSLITTWQQEIESRFLLRSILYYDGKSDSGSTFTFNQQAATAKELFDAFLVAYPAYTYTQDPVTGVIWLHPKSIKYQDILKDKIKIERPAMQISMYMDVLEPLCNILSPKVITEYSLEGTPDASCEYAIDLSPGVYSTRDILNDCCLNNPTKSFCIFVAPSGVLLRDGTLTIDPVNLSFNNPLYPPPSAAVKFWETEIGKSTNGIPSAVELSVAMSNADPRKRWAARSYFEMTRMNYIAEDILRKSDSPEKAVWAALEIEAATYRGINDPQYLIYVAPEFTNNLTQIKNPCLALVVSLELTREKQDTSYLDSIVSSHKYSNAEIASIKPDIYRLAHESKLVLDKLESMKLDVPEFSPESLREMESNHLFTFIPSE
jgi:hypothetical protein